MAKDSPQRNQDEILERLGRVEEQLTTIARRGRGRGAPLRTFALGALLGGGAALLYAPQRGEQTRQRVLQAKDQATQAAGPARERVAHLAGQAQQVTGQIKDRVLSISAQRGTPPATAQLSTAPPPAEAPAPGAPLPGAETR